MNGNDDPFVGYIGPLSPANSPPPTPSSTNTTNRADYISVPEVAPVNQVIIHRVSMRASQNFSATPSSSSSISRHDQAQYTALLNQFQNERASQENDFSDDSSQNFLGGNTAGIAPASVNAIQITTVGAYHVDAFPANRASLNKLHAKLDKRQRNNLASRKSKAKAKQKAQWIAQNEQNLERENRELRQRIASLQDQAARVEAENVRLQALLAAAGNAVRVEVERDLSQNQLDDM